MRICLIQQQATENVENNIERGVQKFRRAAESGAELVAFAELAFLPFLPQDPADNDSSRWAETIPGRTTEIFAGLSREYGVVTVLNLFQTDGVNTYDASPVIDADGTLLGVTRMAHIMDGLGFFEKGYYTPGNNIQFVYQTRSGRIGVAVCYDRHFPEYMRQLGLDGAELVIVPQAGAVGEWPTGLFEAELQVAAFQNGYYAALVNRVGREKKLHFSGESFAVDPWGRVLAQAPQKEEYLLHVDCDLETIPDCPAKKFFLPDRRPDLYRSFRLFD